MQIQEYIFHIVTIIVLLSLYWEVRSRHTAFLLVAGLCAIGLDISLLERPQWFQAVLPLALWLNKALTWLLGLGTLAFLGRCLWPYPFLALKPEEILRHGRELLDSGRFEQAIQCYRQALARNPRSPTARCGLGAAFLMTGQFEAARDELIKVSKSSPDFVWARNSLAVAYMRLEKLVEAEAEWKAALKIAPDKLYGRVGLGLLFLLTNRQVEGQAMLAPILATDDPLFVQRQIVIQMVELGRVEEIPLVLDWVNEQYQQQSRTDA